MKFKWHSGWLFPLVLAIGLGGLSAWLGRITEVSVEEVVLNPNEPQYEMNNINGQMFDEAGYLKTILPLNEHGSCPKVKMFI